MRINRNVPVTYACNQYIMQKVVAISILNRKSSYNRDNGILSAAETSSTDVKPAIEMTNCIRENILSQVSQSMNAQANQKSRKGPCC